MAASRKPGDLSMRELDVVDDIEEPGSKDDGEAAAESDRHSDEPDPDDDPIVAEYEVYITPESDHELYMIQFFGRDAKHPFTGGSAPTEMRIKPKSGYVEVDVPINIHRYYDKVKGVRMGEALRKSKELGQTAYGAAAGFQLAMPKPTKRPGAAPPDDPDADDAAPVATIEDDDKIAEYIANFDDANEKGHVLNTMTWRGQIVYRDETKPNYMIGVFRGNELHLTRLDGIIQVYPGLSHIDAASHLEAISHRREPTDPKAVLPTVKKAAEEHSLAEAMKEAAEEKWAKLKWHDSESGVAYEGFNKRLFYPDPENAPVIMVDGDAWREDMFPGRSGRKQEEELDLDSD